MSLSPAAVTFDCADALAVATFWSAALDRPLDADPSTAFASMGHSPDHAGEDVAWLFAQVPEAKTAKNRMHLDLTAPDREAEVLRLVDLGAKRLADKDEWGVRWTVLADPEGNEFCVAQE